CISFTIIKSDDIVFLGGEDRIMAHAVSDGKVLWEGKTDGKVYGMAVSGDCLYASTDKGIIHCFSPAEISRKRTASIKKNKKEEPYPKDKLTALYETAAQTAIDTVETKKGFCLVLDSGDGRLAYELAKRSELRIIGVEKNLDKVQKSRKFLRETGFYGKRVVIHHNNSGNLEYPKYFANLIVSDEALLGGGISMSAEEVLGRLRPCGGVFCLQSPDNQNSGNFLEKWGGSSFKNWKIKPGANNMIMRIARRGPLEGAGEWTHLYADPGNTACSNDELVQDVMDIQWFGEPGPLNIVNRHYRTTSPLYKNGRFFVAGDNIIFCVDAYNGTMLWQKNLPATKRTRIFLDSGNMAVDNDFLYIASSNTCFVLDVKTGQIKKTYKVPDGHGGNSLNWGWITYGKKNIVGSTRGRKILHSRPKNGEDKSAWRLNMPVFTSKLLFGIDKKSGKTSWIHKNGLIINSTTTVMDDRIYFVESINSEPYNDERISIKKLFSNGEQYLVSLDINSGKENFRKKLDTTAFTQPVYLNGSQGIILLSGAKPEKNSLIYSYRAFDGNTGKILWKTSHAAFHGKADDSHGQQHRHPTIIKNTVFAWPYAYDLKTGEKLEYWKMDRRGHGCGGVSASANHLFWRGNNSWMINVKQGCRARRLTHVSRPGCWINAIPAGGLVFVPESSSGCLCAYSIQTSITFGPR
ncbi:PQQ-binding-like beta-propeller repeat protein, partial [Verrucomicrobiota bacterium]